MAKLTYEQRMELLCDSFPCLRGAAGASPWNPELLCTWYPCASSGERHVIQFVLHVWNSSADWPCGRFDAMRALQTWSNDNRRAFQAWVADPWWA